MILHFSNTKSQLPPPKKNPKKNGTRHCRRVLAAALERSVRRLRRLETGGDLSMKIGASHSGKPPPERIALTIAPPSGLYDQNHSQTDCQGQERFSSLLLKSHRPGDNGCKGEFGTVAQQMGTKGQRAFHQDGAPSGLLPLLFVSVLVSVSVSFSPRFFLNCVKFFLCFLRLFPSTTRLGLPEKCFLLPKPQTKQNKTTKCPEACLSHTNNLSDSLPV